MPSVNAGLLIAGAIAAFLGAFGIFITTLTVEPLAKMSIVPQTEYAAIGETFTIHLVVESSVPVNVFGGELRFDSSILRVESIDYNTSIADLWAELPWYSNGDGTLNFGGGTTQEGGFTGRGELISVTFKTLSIGAGNIAVNSPRILRHDGAGTDVQLRDVVESTVHINEPVSDVNLIAAHPVGNTFTVTPKTVTTDLNGDGKQSLADVSIFMLNIVSDDPRFDFNQDGAVNTKDLAIMLSK